MLKSLKGVFSFQQTILFAAVISTQIAVSGYSKKACAADKILPALPRVLQSLIYKHLGTEVMTLAEDQKLGEGIHRSGIWTDPVNVASYQDLNQSRYEDVK